MDFNHVEFATRDSTYLLSWRQGYTDGHLVCLAGTLAGDHIGPVDVLDTLRQVIDSAREGTSLHLVDVDRQAVCSTTAVERRSVKVYAPCIGGGIDELRCRMNAHHIALKALSHSHVDYHEPCPAH